MALSKAPAASTLESFSHFTKSLLISVVPFVNIRLNKTRSQEFGLHGAIFANQPAWFQQRDLPSMGVPEWIAWK